MVGRGQIRLKLVWKMLKKCAPGYERVQKTHNWRVTWQGKAYYRLPLGSHGHRRNAEVEIGHVRSLVRYLGIEECAERELEQLS